MQIKRVSNTILASRHFERKKSMEWENGKKDKNKTFNNFLQEFYSRNSFD